MAFEIIKTVLIIAGVVFGSSLSISGIAKVGKMQLSAILAMPSGDAPHAVNVSHCMLILLLELLRYCAMGVFAIVRFQITVVNIFQEKISI